jgi:hypothetical protein
MVHPSLFQGTKFIFIINLILYYFFVLAPECNWSSAAWACPDLAHQRGRGCSLIPWWRSWIGGCGGRGVADPGRPEETSDHIHVSFCIYNLFWINFVPFLFG